MSMVHSARLFIAVLCSFAIAEVCFAGEPVSLGGVASTPQAHPAPPGVDEHAGLIAGIEARYKGVQSLSGAFVQIVQSDIFGEEKQTGRVQMQRPAKMRWSFTEGGKEFITDGKRMWIFTPEDKQVIQFDDISGQATDAQNVLQSLDRLREFFSVEVLESSPSGYRLRLIPKKSPQMKEIILVLGADYGLTGLETTDLYDSKTVLHFSEVVLNAKIKASRFDFVVPEGIELIKSDSI